MTADPKSSPAAQRRAAGPKPGSGAARSGPHDHGRAQNQGHAHAHCEGHGAHVTGLNLTPGRRAILDLLCEAGRPLGAYDMLDRLAGASGRRPAPLAVYRALDYLLENGLVHRLASRNAFVACGRRHAQAEPVVFLICDSCGKVEESASPEFARNLAQTAAAAGFRSNGAVIEVSGSCATCAGRTQDGHEQEKMKP